MPRVELIYDMDCPNAERAREALLRGFSEAGLPPSWTEWDRKSPGIPAYVRQYGSPTILVDGRDVTGAGPNEGHDSCRIYDHHAEGLKGVPPVHSIVSAFGKGVFASARPAEGGRGWRHFLAFVPGVGAAFLPVGTCPACWPAYAGVLGSLGLGFLLNSTFLLPVTMGFLGLALFALAFRARTRRGYGPLMLGMASVGLILTFKFAYASAPFVYAGLLGLVAASVWNAWPKRAGQIGSCPKCAQQQQPIETTNAS